MKYVMRHADFGKILYAHDKKVLELQLAEAMEHLEKLKPSLKLWIKQGRTAPPPPPPDPTPPPQPVVVPTPAPVVQPRPQQPPVDPDFGELEASMGNSPTAAKADDRTSSPAGAVGPAPRPSTPPQPSAAAVQQGSTGGVFDKLAGASTADKLVSFMAMPEDQRRQARG